MTGALSAVRRWPVRGAIFAIELYRTYVSPMRPPTCRFSPTCSRYAVEALSEYGLVKGGWLAAVRLVKCGPWHRGGWDPIPEPRGRRADAAADNVWGTPAQQRGEGKSCV